MCQGDSSAKKHRKVTLYHHVSTSVTAAFSRGYCKPCIVPKGLRNLFRVLSAEDIHRSEDKKDNAACLH